MGTENVDSVTIITVFIGIMIISTILLLLYNVVEPKFYMCLFNLSLHFILFTVF